MIWGPATEAGAAAAEGDDGALYCTLYMASSSGFLLMLQMTIMAVARWGWVAIGPIHADDANCPWRRRINALAFWQKRERTLPTPPVRQRWNLNLNVCWMRSVLFSTITPRGQLNLHRIRRVNKLRSRKCIRYIKEIKVWIYYSCAILW